MSVFEFVFWLRSAFAISVLPMQCWVICTNLIRCHVITTHPPAPLLKHLLLNSKKNNNSPLAPSPRPECPFQFVGSLSLLVACTAE